MNRAERRAMGFRGPAYTRIVNDARPRYVRRHSTVAVQAAVSGGPITRRDRKRIARIGREADRLGLYPEGYRAR